MLTFTDKPMWDGKKYNTLNEAALAMSEDIVLNGAQPEYDLNFDKVPEALRTQLLFLYVISKKEIATVLTSKLCAKYKSKPVLKYLYRNNPFFAGNISIPANYAMNKSMHVTALGELGEIYGSYTKNVRTKSGLCPFDTVLSFMCDKVLFNPKTTLFPRIIDMTKILGRNKATRALLENTNHSDLPKLWVLYAQMKAGDLYAQELISVDNLRKGDYACKTHDYVKGAYAEKMVRVAPAMRDVDNYYEWLKVATDSPIDPLEVSDAEALFGKKVVSMSEFMNPPEPEVVPGAIEVGQSVEVASAEAIIHKQEPLTEQNAPVEMYKVAESYCGQYGESLYTVMNSMFATQPKTWEECFRAVPVLLRMVKGKVNVKKLTEYCKVLEKVYGSVVLKYEP